MVSRSLCVSIDVNNTIENGDNKQFIRTKSLLWENISNNHYAYSSLCYYDVFVLEIKTLFI